MSLKNLYKGNGKREDLEEIFATISWTATSVLIGVCLAAIANTTFPIIMLPMGSPALVSAIIIAIAPLVGLFVIASVDEHIISPTIEHFSSKEKEADPSLSCS